MEAVKLCPHFHHGERPPPTLHPQRLNEPIAELLLKNGAAVDVANKEGATPLWIAGRVWVLDGVAYWVVDSWLLDGLCCGRSCGL